MTEPATTVTRVPVAIVGGGLVGASLAIALGRLGIQVAMLEAMPFRDAPPPSYDDRTLALNRASCQILRGLGLWQTLEPDATPIRQVNVSVLGKPGKVVLDPAEVGQEAFGHVVEARIFGAAVVETLPRMETVQLMCPVKVVAVETGLEHVRLQLETGTGSEELHCGLLVAADGAQSFVRSALGINSRTHDYQQVAVICNVTPSEPHQGRAFERFTPTGPFALLPHQGSRCGLVWSVAADEADRLMEMDDEAFLAEATERSGRVLGALTVAGRRSRYPLQQVVAEQDVAQRSLIIGNAAHTIHPVGAQGFNLGLRDVAVLAELMASHAAGAADADFGDPGLLAAYHDWRQADQRTTIAYTDLMARAWGHPSALVGLARGATLWAHALVPALRRQLVLRAMGFGGRVPALAMSEALPGMAAG